MFVLTLCFFLFERTGSLGSGEEGEATLAARFEGENRGEADGREEGKEAGDIEGTGREGEMKGAGRSWNGNEDNGCAGGGGRSCCLSS